MKELNKPIYIVLAALAIAQTASSNNACQANNGSQLFDSKCAGCHTVGKGPLVGPDLASTKDWKQSDLTAGVKRMSAMAGPLSDEEVASLVKFLASGEAAQEKEKTTTPTGPVSPAPEASRQSKPQEVGSSAEGELLFSGKQSLMNGGMACAACHTTNGGHGSMGPDLKDVAARFPEAALAAACESTPFKVMKAAYAKHPVTRKEALSLSKYMCTLKDSPSRKDPPLALYGAGGAAALLAIVALGYRNRNGGVRARLKRNQQ